MIVVEHLEPVATQIEGEVASFILSEGDLVINFQGIRYRFLPIEGECIKVHLGTKQYMNIQDIFVFVSDSKIIRMTLYNFILTSNLGMVLNPILEHNIFFKLHKSNEEQPVLIRAEIHNFVWELEILNIKKAIDEALVVGDKEAFLKLTSELKIKEAQKPTEQDNVT